MTVVAPSPEFWLVVRASDGSNYWRFGRWQGGNYLLQQVANNGLGGPALEVLAAVAPAAGDRLSCRLDSVLACSVNGTAVVRTADAFNASARHVGLAAYSGGGGSLVRFDDVVVQAPPAPPAAPDLRVTVRAGSSSATTGSPVSWTATVANAGSGTAAAATATVTPPAELTGTTVSSSAGSCSPSGSGWACALGDRPAGSTATITVNATAPSQPASLTLSVSASSSTADANPADNSGSATVTTASPPPAGAATASDTFNRPDAASLGSAETGQPWAVTAGSARVVAQQAEATGTGYTLATVASGAAAGSASVRVPTISAEYWLIVRASSPSSYWRFGRWQSGAYQLQQVNENSLGSPVLTPVGTATPAAGDLLSCSLGATLTCSVNGTTVVRTTDTFNASATSVGFAAGTGPATRFDDFAVVPPPGPDLRVSIGGPGTVERAMPVSWSGTVANAGTAPATGSVVTVTPPSGLTSPQVSTSTGSCASAGATWTCSTGTRAAGSRLTVSVSGVAPAHASTMTVTIGASAQEPDLDPSTDSATFATTVQDPAAAATPLLDRFDRPDATSLGTAGTGQAWASWSGTARISSEQAETVGTRYSLAVVDSGTATGTAAVTVTSPSPEFWLVLRASDAQNYWRFGRWQGGAYQLQQVVRGNLGNPPRTTSATVMAAAGDRLSCEVESTIACSANGTTVVTTSDGFNATSRYVGLAGGAVTSTRFDDLSVTTRASSGEPDLKATVSASATAVQTGSPVAWTGTVRNGGTAVATATVVTVTPPSSLVGTAVSSSAGPCVELATTWQCSVGDRAVGTSLTVSVSGTAPSQPTSLTTTVSASAQETDTDPGDNMASATVEVWAPEAATPPVTDSFDRPDSASLGTADTGQAWTDVAGSFGVSAGTAAPGGPGTNQAMLDPGFAYGTYQVTVRAGAAPDAFAVVLRGRDADNSVRIGPDSSGYYRVWKVVGGSAQPFGVSLRRADVAPRNGDVIRIVNRPDDGVFVSVNGRHVLDAGDPVLLGERRFGLLASSTAVRFDSVSISSLMSSGVTTTDTFSAADGPLAYRWTETGTHYGWNASYGWVTSSGRATNPGYGLAWVDTTSEVANARVQIRSGAAEAFLVFRYAETADWFRFGHQAGATYAFERVDGGRSSTVVARTSVVPQAVDVVEVRQSTDGRVEGYVNGVLVASFTDATFSRRSTAYGIEGNAAVFDDFTVSAK